MRGFLPDTNVLSEFSRTGAPHPRVERWLRSTGEDLIFLSVMTVAEIRRGIELLPDGRRRTQLEQWQEQFIGRNAEARRSPPSTA